MWTIVASSIILAMTLVDTAPSEGNGTSLSNLKPRISEFKKNVHHILEGARIRRRRQLDGLDPSDYKLLFGSAVVEDLPYLSDFNLTFWIPVNEKDKRQVFIGTTGGYIMLFELSDVDDKTANFVAGSSIEDFAIKAKAFSYYDEEWFAVLHYSREEYYIRMYKRVGRGLEEQQKIDLSGFSDMELVNMKGTHYLVAATYTTSTAQGYSYQASVTLYRWAKSQFDAVASRTTYGARSVVCWSLDGSLYIALAQEFNDEGNFQVGSPIYLYNSKEEDRLVLWEMLATYGPTKVQHFFVAGNHYIVIIGKRDAVIYWWSNGQFLEWQSLVGTAGAADVSVLLLRDGEVAIAIALKGGAQFYTLDSSGYYIISYQMSFQENLRSLQFMFSGKAHYVLALFAESQRHAIWRLTLASHYLPSIQSLDILQQCLSNTQDELKHRQGELESLRKDLSRVWVRGSDQSITAAVIIKGKVVSNLQSTIKNVIVIRDVNIPDIPMSLVIDSLVKMRDSVEDVEHQLAEVVFNNKRQNIRGFKRFVELVYIPSLELEKIANDVSINEVRISRLQNFGLRKFGDQVFKNATFISDIYAETTTVETLNGISLDDFLLLHGKQTVTGSLAFLDASVSSVSAETVNSIPFEDIITTNSRQDITGFKKFLHLKSDVVDVLGETNEVDLSSISQKIATVDGYNPFSGHLTFLKPMTISGNVFLSGKLNKMVDISRLVHQSVNHDFPQDLTGHYTFKGMQTLTGDALVGGSINNIPLDNLLTLSTNQKMYADISFSAPLEITRDLVVDAVNGVDLSEQVLQKLPPHQFVSGRKVFTKDITADFVDMTEYTTLDNVDPSFLVQDIVQHTQGVVKQNHTVFKDVDVLGNLTVIGGDINGLDVWNLFSSVWLKSEEQVIELPVTANFLHFENDLDVSLVNGLKLNADLVRSYLDETIEATKTFLSKTVFRSFKTINGTVNGIHLASLKTELDSYRKEGTVEGTKNIKSLGIHGNLQVTKLNELLVTDFMHPNAPQTVNGYVEIPAGIVFILGNTKLDAISFTGFNDENLQDYFKDAVTIANLSRPLKNKHFKHLKAANLHLPLGSLINGVCLHEMTQRVVFLNVDQLITAPKTFASSLNFRKLINVGTMNGIELASYLGEIVLIDEVSKISNKEFSGDFQATNAFVQGAINGIKIEDLAENVFYKSENNVISQRFVFEGDIDVEDLYTSVLDGIKWTDLIFLRKDEFLETAWFLGKTVAVKDIFVTGLVNGCDLSQVSSSLYMNKTNQVINKNVHVHSILVVGNLLVRNVINGIPMEVLNNFLTISEDQVITSNAVIEANLVVDELRMTDEANSDLAFIVSDAVRHSIQQEITGQKTFTGSVTVNVLTGGDIFASKVNGVDLEELESTTVWKNGHQEVNGEKTFSSLSADVVVLNGFINSLKLPEELVRTDVSEYITHPTYFMSDVDVATELVVRGLIDGVDINQLIPHRVTLYSHQNISSALTFYDDTVIHGELTIDGTVNEIVLDLVATVKPVHPLQGYKIFVDLYVSGPVTASLVNGYDVTSLSSNTVRYNEEDYINGVQVFEKPIHAQNSLYVEWINSIPIRRLTEAFTSLMDNLKITMEYLKDLSTSLQQKIIHQLLESQEKASKFAYFILHQEIDMGPTSRILYGYDLQQPGSRFHHSLVIWTTEKQCVFMEKCCHLEFSYWLQVKQSGFVTADSAAQSGRYFPIHNKVPSMASKNFFMWTDVPDIQPKWCSDKHTKVVLGSMDSGSMEAFIDIQDAALLSDVRSFRKGELYAVAGFYIDPKREEYGNTIVYAYDNSRHWTERQVLPSAGILSLDVVSYTQGYREEVLLALGTGMNTNPPSYSTIYKWNDSGKAFDFLQNIPSRYVTSTLWIRKGRHLLLSLAGVDYWPSKLIDCSEFATGGQIDIYEYKEQLKWIQSIPIGGIMSTTSFSVDGDVYLAAASSQHQRIYIFEWRGYAGFVEIQSMYADVRHLSTYTIGDDVYMTVASISGPSKILKMVRRGQNSETGKYIGRTLLEQQDEAPQEEKLIRSCLK